MEQDLIKTFPNVLTARSCASQQNFEMAADIYSEILESAIQKYPEDSPIICIIYLEYASALINSCEIHFQNEISLISSYNAPKLSEKVEKEDDLIIAWEVLEISKNVFTAAKESEHLAQAYYLLAEIQLLNNEFLDALKDYTNAITELEKIKKEKTVRYCECLYKIAICNEFLKYFDESLVCLEKIKKIYENCEDELGFENKKVLMDDISEKIEEVKLRKEREEGKELEKVEEIESKSEVDEPVININNLKKNKKD
ncbi:hypothetical protein GVAV_003520 [Gurleya vavrai]